MKVTQVQAMSLTQTDEEFRAWVKWHSKFVQDGLILVCRLIVEYGLYGYLNRMAILETRVDFPLLLQTLATFCSTHLTI